MAINYPQFSKLNAADMGGLGGFDLGEAIKSGLNNYKNYQQSKYEPRNLENKAQGDELMNKINDAKAKYAMQNEKANLESTQAGTGLTQQNTYKQQLLNKYLPEREPAEIAEIKARGNYYNSGGSAGSTGSKDYQSYVNGISQDNPGLSQDQLREATDVIAKGGTQLSDGTKLNPMSFGTRSAFDRAVKATTTAQQLNTLNSANQADAELDVFTNLANKMRAPYGTTYFGKSPAQIVDSFKNDDASQTRLGKLIAANALEFDIAQARNRIAGGAPGITSTNQMMEEAKQHIALYGPRLSGKAKSVANEELNKALRSGLEARNKGGYGAGNLYQRQFSKNNTENTPDNANKYKFNPNDYEIPPGYSIVYKDGEGYAFPAEKAKQKVETEGYSYE